MINRKTPPAVGRGSFSLSKKASQSLLPAGFLCSLVVSAIGFLMTDVFHCFLLWAAGRSVWSTGLFLMLREFCVTAPLTVPATALYRAVHRRAHRDD